MIIEGQTIGPFAVEREIGSGAMGAVYLAKYAKTGQHVAIKVIAPGLGDNEKIMARFEREAGMLKQLKHPNIVRLLATGKFHGRPFYAMEYIEGESLDALLLRKGHLDWQEVVEMGKQICGALQHAHANGIIHRDLKPSNLMIAKNNVVKLTDFGIAKDMDATGLTSAHCTVGTAAYMSPEQCRGERDLTPKSDLYALGILFYEMLTGQKPFFAENAMDMFLQHVQGTFKRPSEHVLDVPPWLDLLVCQLLEKKPEHRPLDAKMVAEGLDEVRQKIRSQKSVAAETARKVARAARDTMDRKAAATVVAARKGKKQRLRQQLADRARIFMAAGLGLGLVIVLGLIVLAFLPTSPEKLAAEAERLIDKGNAQFAQGDDSAWYTWDEGEKVLNRVAAGHPNTPAAAKAKERLDYIHAGKLYLRGHKWLVGKTVDWEAARKNGFDELLNKYDSIQPFADKARGELQPHEAPNLWRNAQKDADPNDAKGWKSAHETLRLLLKRYPHSDLASEARDLQTRLNVHEEALAKIQRAEETKQSWPRPLNHGEDLALQALASERANQMDKAKTLWQELKTWGGKRGANLKPNKEDLENKPWIALAEAKLAAWK